MEMAWVKKLGSQGDFGDFAGDEEGVVIVEGSAAGEANHFVGDVHADDAAIGNDFGEAAGEPAGAAANVEDIVGGREAHFFDDGEGDGEMVAFHAIAATGFGPAVEFVAEGLGEMFGHEGGCRK